VKPRERRIIIHTHINGKFHQEGRSDSISKLVIEIIERFAATGNLGSEGTVTLTCDGNRLVPNLKTDAGNVAFATSTPG
jgi:hypothetical protein